MEQPKEMPAPTGTAWARAEPWFFAVVSALVIAAYAYQFGRVPPGLFIDETSVGYNARAVGRTGADQYGTTLPLFFRALDDYKSPWYLYFAAVSEKIFGPSPVSVRLPSALAAFGMAIALFFLVRALTGNQRLARWVALLSLLAPSIFVYGRHAVSETSVLPVFFVLGLLAFLAFDRSPTRRTAALAGIALGLITYTYTTARLLAPMMVAAAGVCALLDRRMRSQVPWFLGGALAAGLPMAIYLVIHPGTVGLRFQGLWVMRDHPSLAVAAQRVVEHYFQHLLSIDFLFRHGDSNLRHNIGQGLLPVWLALPLLLGFWSLWKRRSQTMARFIFACVLLAPVPVSLCHDAWPHASRMLHFVPLAFAIGALAASDLLDEVQPRRGLAAVAVAGALFEGGMFLEGYFVDYPAAAQAAFDGGAGEAVRIAFAARRGEEPLYAPDHFFGFNGTYFEFWGDLDPVRRRRDGLEGMGIRPFGWGRRPEPGSLVIAPGDSRPFSEPADLVGVSRSVGNGAPLYSVYRVRAP